MWLGEGYSPEVKTEKSENAKICLNFKFFLGGGVFSSQN